MKKKKLQYYAVFEPAKEGGYNVSFPQFPGCVTFGRTFEETKKKAREVLELWLEELMAEKEKIPAFNLRPIIDEVQVFLPPKGKKAVTPFIGILTAVSLFRSHYMGKTSQFLLAHYWP